MNLGLATGRQSGVVVLDVDPRHGGDESIAKLAELHGPLPPTRRHKTPSGGYHLLFGWELGRPVGNRLPALSGASGIDVRGEGGLIVAPPSRHLKGVYQVDDSSPTELARLPEWLLEGVAVEPAELTPHDRADRWAVAALRNECRAIKEAPQGNRNETLFTASWKIGEIIAGGGLDQEKATHELSSAGLHAGLDEPEVDDVVARGLDYGAERPRVADPPFSGRAEALAVVDEIHGAIRGVTWSGHAGTRQRAVLEAMVSLARDQGGPQITAGVRRIALEAGYSDHATVMRALKELQEARWVSRMHKGTSQEDPSEWKLQDPTPSAWQSEGSESLVGVQGDQGSTPELSSEGPNHQMPPEEAGTDQCATAPPQSPTDTPQLPTGATHLQTGCGQVPTTPYQVPTAYPQLPNEATPSLRRSGTGGRLSDADQGNALGGTMPIEHDAFRQRGYKWLGDRLWYQRGVTKMGWRIYEHLLRHGVSTQARLARETGISPSTIGRHRTRLQEFGLIERIPGGLRAIPRDESYLDEVARTCWTHGASKKQREAYEWWDGWFGPEKSMSSVEVLDHSNDEGDRAAPGAPGDEGSPEQRLIEGETWDSEVSAVGVERDVEGHRSRSDQWTSTEEAL